MRGLPFTLVLIAVSAVVFAFGRWLNVSYAFFTAYIVAQYIVCSAPPGTSWAGTPAT
jgi:branched-chain amino acid transport system permease protein